MNSMLLTSFKRNYCVDVGDEGLKDITISYLIDQTGVTALLFQRFCPFDCSVFLQPALPLSVSAAAATPLF